MTRKILLALTLCCSLTLWADNNALLKKIEDKNSTVQSVECSFTQLRTVAATKSKTNLVGTLYYASPDKLAMPYSQPATDLLIINGTTFHLNRSGKANTFDTSKNAPMRSLRNTLLYCIQGKAQTVASDNNASCSVKEEGAHYVVTITANTKVARGYKRIVLKYQKSDCMLVSMLMEEPNGTSNLYTMSHLKIGTKIDPSHFSIPKK